ncbi:hypothetical protein [Nocardia sp. XZ_19_369]|uniref:hypothetical protein n=1 Tax=Nocardia sp. XZ_19_369 TaxID=2769487 RepID=UPI00188E7C49|nr:hypothetical protein [Nocardia sp. XZ_19_369]
MDEAYYAQQLKNHHWWSERIDKLLDGLRARLEARSAALGDDESPYVFYDAMREQAETPILVDSIAATLYRGQIPITPAERDLFRELMYKIEDPDPMFRFLHDRDHIMTELNVVDELPPLPDPGQDGHPALEVSIDLHRQPE